MTELLIGCPIAHRAWVLPRWFDHVEEACYVADVKARFVFVGDERDDCRDIIGERAPGAVFVHTPTRKGDDTRTWKPERFQEMVALRNRLLTAVRAEAPDAFLSLDSDILLHELGISYLLDDLDEYDAVGGKCYMTPTGVNAPSWARIGREGQIQRTDSESYFRAEVIMAIKMMSPAAYNVDYQFDLQGEDIGWSKACAQIGLRLGWDGRIANKHVIAPWLLETIDNRVGF